MPVDRGWFYEAFGLGIRANAPLPGFHEVEPRAVDLEIEWSDRDVPDGDRSQDETLYTSGGRTADGVPFFTVTRPQGASFGALRCCHVSDTGLGTFDIEPSGRRIVISVAPDGPKADVMAYLAGHVMGCVLRLRGMTCLHAAVVIIKGRAIAVMGPKGSGKSTLAAALAARGYPVLTDDIAAIADAGDAITVAPAYPRMRLWPDTQQFVPELSMDGLPRVLKTMDKRYQPLTVDDAASRWRFSTRRARLAAVYVLAGSTESIATVTAARRSRGVMLLMANTYAGYLEDRAMRERDFRLLGTVVSRAAVCVASGPRGLEGFHDRCARIIEHAESLP